MFAGRKNVYDIVTSLWLPGFRIALGKYGEQQRDARKVAMKRSKSCDGRLLKAATAGLRVESDGRRGGRVEKGGVSRATVSVGNRSAGYLIRSCRGQAARVIPSCDLSERSPNKFSHTHTHILTIFKMKTTLGEVCFIMTMLDPNQ